MPSRRNFIKTTTVLTAGLMFSTNKNFLFENRVPVYAHLWVYASKYPPDWDCTPILDTVFGDLKYACLAGVEVMEVLLRHDDAVTRFNDLIAKYNLPVVGTSYYADMWDKDQQQKILDDVELVTKRYITI